MIINKNYHEHFVITFRVGFQLPEGGAEDGLVADDALLEEVVHGGAPQEEPDQLLADVRLARLVHARLKT